MNSYGLPAWIRVSVGTMAENQRFLAALAKIMETR
jgi:histidinol-phosphate/aromatic aminotransferase/cobyric acid decarboxylase-like protein